MKLALPAWLSARLPKIPKLTRMQHRSAVLLGLCVVGQMTPFASKLPLPDTVAWMTDLATHWQFVYGIVALVCATHLTFAFRTARPLAIALAGLSLSWLSVYPAALRATSGPHDTVVVASANLHMGGADMDALHAWVTELNPDVLILEEVTVDAAMQLKSWTTFQTMGFRPSEDPFGLAVLVRDKADFQWNTDGPTPSVSVTARSQNREYVVHGVHPMPPISVDDHRARAALLSNMVTMARIKPTIVVGDFNASPWSSAMPRDVLLRATPLRPTWNYVLPIDHILATQQWSVLKAGTGPAIGSDHRPVWARLALGS